MRFDILLISNCYLQSIAMKWRTSEHDPDLYDARMRDWYIKVIRNIHY